MQNVAVDVRPYLEALHELEKQIKMSSASLILHPNGDGAVRLDTFFSGSITVDFDEGYIMDAITRLAEKAKELA